MTWYKRYFPPITSRHIFPTEESPSGMHHCITNRKIFEKEGSEKAISMTCETGAQNILRKRPKGPLSKPNSGGYSLRVALGWDEQKYRKAQVRDCNNCNFITSATILTIGSSNCSIRYALNILMRVIRFDLKVLRRWKAFVQRYSSHRFLAKMPLNNDWSTGYQTFTMSYAVYRLLAG